MTLPAGGYMNQNTRTEGEMKVSWEDFLAGLKQVPGAGVAEQALTLATDAIMPAVGASGIISVDTEAAAAADNLANITLTYVPDGSCLLLRIANNARVVTVKHLAGGSGQISLRSAADLVMSATTQWLCVKRTGTLLEEQWRSGKEALKGATADGLTLTGALNQSRGSVAMHATTMNLLCDINDGTGSPVTVTAITNFPQGGAGRVLYPVAGSIITNGATFAVDGEANHTAQAGDSWTFEALTPSTYRVHITKKDGTAVVAVTVTDATIATSDVTTNNASSAKHGFCPKAPADPAKFLNGANPPAFAVPTGTLTAGTALTQNPYAVSTLVTQAHGLAVEPTCYKIILECLTADNGWVTGDRVVVNMLGGASSGNPGWAIYADATNFYMRTTNNLPVLTPKNGAASFTITAASWKIIITPYKLN